MGFLRFDDSGKVVEMSKGRDMKNSHREKGRRRNYTDHPYREKGITPRRRVPHG